MKSNIAACHLKLADWKAAVEAATAALDALDHLAPKESEVQDEKEDDASVVEINGDELAAEEQLEKLKMSDERRNDIQRIRTKALMRRAKGKYEQGGWGNLQGAEDGIYIRHPDGFFWKSNNRASFAYKINRSLTRPFHIQITKLYQKFPHYLQPIEKS